MSAEASKTGSTLFAVITDPSSKEGWEKFVDRYSPAIYGWCRAKRLQEADAEDITEEVLSKFWEQTRKNSFQYNPRKTFRGWLRTVTKNAFLDFCRHNRRRPGSGVPGLIDSEADSEELANELEREFERELYEQAKKFVRLRVEPKTWEVFQLVENSRPAAEIAKLLEMKVAAVHMAKKRVIDMIKEEIRKLESQHEHNR
jgi:RNA polymerase sigma factor (sigma-70 family)